MKRNWVLRFLIVLPFLWLAACTTADMVPVTSFVASAEAADKYKLGDTEVRIVTTRYGSNGYTLIALHENESTSVRAARQVLPRTGGTLVELRHGGGREVSFTLEGKRYSFDPNRIFTDRGLGRTLKGGSEPAAIEAVKGLRNELLKRLTSRAVVALHNNTNGSYSLASYQAGGSLSRDAAEVHAAAGQDSDDFFFVTNRQPFSVIKSAGFNVVLQSRSVSDDGSLSVWAARSGVVYINVEAENGHQTTQVRMLEALLSP